MPPDGPETAARLAALDGAQVLDAVSCQAARHRLPSIGAVLTGDRAFLRFLERTGRTARPLAAAVPSAAGQPSPLPGQVGPETAAAILASCDRATEVGCRDRAVLLLLHRYGLRPVEVTRLRLPDLRWRAGEFVVHGKAGRVDVLPLLRRRGGDRGVPADPPGRAAGVAAVFLSARAPVQPMRKNSVGSLVGRACARAGVSRTGPRAFRHAVGHDLLKGGASLVEIRDVLRHRDIETTSAYTRVDVSALRPLARPWPGTGRRQAAEMTPVTGAAPDAGLSRLEPQRGIGGDQLSHPPVIMRRHLDDPQFVVSYGGAEFRSQPGTPAPLRIGEQMANLGDRQ